MKEELEKEFAKRDITDVKSIIPEVLKHSPKFMAFLTACLSEVQKGEDVNEQLYSQRNIFDAIGKQLDDIGVILQEEREYLESDENYRARLFGKAANLFASGEIPAVKAGFRGLTGEQAVTLLEYYPVFFSLRVRTDQVFSVKFLDAVADIKVGGVGFEMIQEPSNCFRLADEPGTFTETGLMDETAEYPIFRLATDPGTFTESGLLNDDDNVKSRFYDLYEQSASDPQTNNAVKMAFLLE
jgi:hypothetical protein